MAKKLELVREEKLHRLLPGRTEKSRLEASGVALVNDATALVVFDNLNLVARLDLSLKPNAGNQLMPAPSLGSGFEDVAIDHKAGGVLCLVETVEDFDGQLRGFVAEYDRDATFVRCTRLHGEFEKANKGFEGLTHVRRGDREYLYALYEDNVGGKGKHGGGRVDVFTRARDGGWKASHQIELPKLAKFEDYSALDYRHEQVVIASQESARVCVARIDEKARALVTGSGAIYRFPSKSYGNVEGVAWLSQDELVAVSDRMKKGQPERCAEKDQMIHVFRIPAD
jgi:hypothetical protein